MGLISEIKQHKARVLKTVAQYTVYMTLGMSVGVIGPTLLDLKEQVNTDLKTISLIMTSRAAGHVIGSLVSKYLKL